MHIRSYNHSAACSLDVYLLLSYALSTAYYFKTRGGTSEIEEGRDLQHRKYNDMYNGNPLTIYNTE